MATEPEEPNLSVAEAARFMVNSRTLEYRRTCIKFWRDKYGESYALAIEKEVRRLWGIKRKPKNGGA